ncbi:MAG: helix-turn-helix transcriptional regulator [Clostridiaceae bacterium]
MEVLSLGEKIKKRRRELNLTLKDVAGTRVTPGQISLVESGKSNPSMDLLDYLAKTLDISVEYFMESESTQVEKICQYLSKMAEINIEMGEYDKARGYLDKGNRYVDKYNLILPKAKNLYINALYEIKMKNYTKAYDYLFQCNVIYSTTNYKTGFIDNFMLVAKTFLDADSVPLAISYFHKSESLFTQGVITDEYMLAKVYFYLAIAYKKQGIIDKSREYTFLAKEKFAILSDNQGYAKFLTKVAEKYEIEGNLEEATKYSTMAMGLFKLNDENREIGKIELNLGKLFADFDDYHEALVHFKKAEGIYSKSRGNDLIEVYLSMADCFAHLSQRESCYETLSYLDRIIEEDDFSINIRMYRLKSRINSLFHNSKEALNNLILGLNIARENNLQEEESEILILIAKYYQDHGKNVDSLRFLEKSMEITTGRGVEM